MDASKERRVFRLAGDNCFAKCESATIEENGLSHWKLYRARGMLKNEPKRQPPSKSDSAIESNTDKAADIDAALKQWGDWKRENAVPTISPKQLQRLKAAVEKAREGS